MNREIKFRVYDSELKYMRDNPLITFQGGRGFTVDGYPPEAKGFHVMQYTNLKDKNGVEIYEGDIIKFDSNGYGNAVVAEIKWDNNLCGWSPFCTQILSAADSYSEWNITSYEVIGNIYENPELLK